MNEFIQTFYKGVYLMEDILILAKYIIVEQAIPSCEPPRMSSPV